MRQLSSSSDAHPTVLWLSSKLRHDCGSEGNPPCFAKPQPTGQPRSAADIEAPLQTSSSVLSIALQSPWGRSPSLRTGETMVAPPRGMRGPMQRVAVAVNIICKATNIIYMISI